MRKALVRPDIVLESDEKRSFALRYSASTACHSSRRAPDMPSALSVSALRKVASASVARRAPLRIVSVASGAVIRLLSSISVTSTATPSSASSPSDQWNTLRIRR